MRFGRGDGHIDAWISNVGSGTYRDLTHGDVRDLVNPLIRVLGFSADASLVTIWNRRADGSQSGDVSILSVPTVGGPLRPYLREAGEFDWSRNGKRLACHTTAPGDPLFVRESGILADRGDGRILIRFGRRTVASWFTRARALGPHFHCALPPQMAGRILCRA
jgi:hypothetical protein